MAFLEPSRARGQQWKPEPPYEVCTGQEGCPMPAEVAYETSISLLGYVLDSLLPIICCCTLAYIVLGVECY